MVAVTNVDGSNPGPNTVNLPDTVQMPVGNIWKNAVFPLTLSPVSVAASTTAEQTFAVTGLLTTDFVAVSVGSTGVGIGVVGSRASAAGVLAVTFLNSTTAAVTPTASQVYTVCVARPQPNWTAPATGSVIDW